MTAAAEGAAGGVLLRQLAGEFASLAEAADQLQQAVARMTIDRTSCTDADACVMQLQALDSLSQVLRDLQRLANAAADGPFARCRADPAFVRQNIRLQSLAERLLGRPGRDDANDPGAFLL